MIKHIRTFFFPNQTIHLYNSSKELITEKLNEIFNRKWTLFDSNNLLGEFIEKDTFEISMKSAAYKTGLIGNAIMVGEIIELQNGQTEIILKVKPNKGLYTMFFVFILIGLIYLFNSIYTGSSRYLLISIAMLIGGPLLCIGISNVQIHALKENFINYIDKNLKLI